MSESFTERVARLATEREVPALHSVDVIEHDPDLIPEIENYERTADDDEIDRLVDGIDILQAYAKWCGKMVPKVGKRRESIMISCPKPEHPDRTPSAWINLDKQTWFCGSCDEGGDKFDIAAFYFGFGSDYKSGKNFPALMRRIAEDAGYTVRSTASGKTYLEPQEETPPPDIAPAVSVLDVEPSGKGPLSDRLSAVRAGKAKIEAKKKEITERTGKRDPGAPFLSLVPEPALVTDEEVAEVPVVEWRDILPADSFMRRWMESTHHDDIPEEFYFWLGMQAVGLAGGRNCVFEDNPPVTGNLFVCLYGASGDGKSRSIRPLLELLSEALPYDPTDEYSTGAYLVPNPGSAESLIDSFAKPIYDPTDPKKVIGHGHVRGLVRMDELSTLIGRASRSGSVMKPTLMEFFDCYNRVELKSRGAGHVIAEAPFASFITTTQPRAVRELLTRTDSDSGFLNRWVIAAGMNKKKVSYGRRPVRIHRCVDPLRDIRAWASTHQKITLSPEAIDIWDAFFHGTVEVERGQDESNLLTRGDLILKKIMLLFALDRHEEVISGATMNDVTKIWTYLKRSYKMLGGEIGAGPFEDARHIIMKAATDYQSKMGKGITMRELNRVLTRMQVPIEVSARVIPMMITHEMLREDIIKGDRGPSTVRYFAVD